MKQSYASIYKGNSFEIKYIINGIQIQNRKVDKLIQLLGIIMQLTSVDKRWLQIFKIFAEKALLPQIKKANGSLAQWEIFDSLISAPNINQNQIQLFVDSLPSLAIDSNLKKEKSRKQSQFNTLSNQQFNPSKTFGGDKGKSFLEPVTNNNAQLRRQSQKEQILKLEAQSKNCSIMSGLEKLLKSLQQNQSYIQGMQKQNFTYQHNGSRPMINYTNSFKVVNNANFGLANQQPNRMSGWLGSQPQNQYKQVNY